MGDSCLELPKDAPRPRLCHLIKRTDFVGYGFNLHAERNKVGQYVGKVDEGSPAHLAGMKEHDRIVEVNGVNIGNENHKQVVERIKTNPDEAQLLVVDRSTDAFYKERKMVLKGTMTSVLYSKTPTMEEQLNASVSKHVTIEETPKQREEDEDPGYATIATTTTMTTTTTPTTTTPPPPSPPPEASSREASSPEAPSHEAPSPAAPEVGQDLPPHVPPKSDIEDFPSPPSPVMIEYENPSSSPNVETTTTPPTPPTPPPQNDDVLSPAMEDFHRDNDNNQQLQIEIPSPIEVGQNDLETSQIDPATPPPPYESLPASTTSEVTPDASPLPSPNGNVTSSSAMKASAPPPPHQVTANTIVDYSNNSNNMNNNNNNDVASGEPVFGLSVADMRARLQSKKKRDGRTKGEADELNFKDKYELFQRL